MDEVLLTKGEHIKIVEKIKKNVFGGDKIEVEQGKRRNQKIYFVNLSEMNGLNSLISHHQSPENNHYD